MECLAGNDFKQIFYEALAFAERQFRYGCAPVGFVAENGCTDMLQMDTDLVSSAGVKNKLDKREVMQVFLDNVFRDCSFSLFSFILVAGHHLPVPYRAPDIRLDYSFGRIRDAANYRLIFFLYLAVCELPCELVQGGTVFCDDDQSRGVFVEPVDNAWSEFRCVELVGVGTEVIKDCVCKCSRPVAKGGMNHHAGGFVDYHQVFVLVHDVQRNVFRREFGCRRSEKGDLYGVNRFYLVIGFDVFSVYQHAMFGNSLLNLIAGGVFNLLREIDIDTHRFLGLGNLQRHFFRFPALGVLFFLFAFYRLILHLGWVLSGSVYSTIITYNDTILMSGEQEAGSFDFDVVVIGSGPGGFEAAIRAARSGFRVCVVEKGAIGGVCVNWGCIPTKALLRSAEIFRLADESGPFGLTIGDSTVDLAQAVKRSRRVVLTASKGVEYSLKQQNVTVKRGAASFADAHTLEIARDGRVDETLTAANIIIASGGSSRELPGLEFDGKTIVSSREVLAMQSAPEKMIVVGGGAIGVEMAWYYNAAGSDVILVEQMPQILPLEDAELGEALKRSLTKAGIEIITGAAVKKADTSGGGVRAVVGMPDGTERVVDAGCMLVAVGVVPGTEGLLLENAGVTTERGFVATDEFCRTNVENIFAIGDVRGGMLLAHKASAEAGVAVKAISGEKNKPVDETRVPRCVYVEPSVACVGYTEKQAAENGYRLKVGRASFAASGKANAYGVREGFVKLVFDARTGELLGGHVLGHGAVELIGELSLARNLGATAEQIAETIHAHPTLSESIKEAAENALEQ